MSSKLVSCLLVAVLVAVGLAAAFSWIACSRTAAPTATPPAADVTKFLAEANATTLRLGILDQQAGWVLENFITPDTEAVSARINQESSDATMRLAKASTSFNNVKVPADERRQLDLLKLCARHGDARPIRRRQRS